MKKVVFVLFFLGYLGTNAQTIEWPGNTKVIDIGDRIDLLKDPAGTLAIDSVSSLTTAGKFVRSKQPVLSFDFSGSVYWLRFSVHNNTADSLVLVLAQAVLPEADLYFKDNTGQWQCTKAGYNVRMDDKLIRHHYQVFPIAKGSKEYYLRLISFSPPVPVRLWNDYDYKIASDNQKMYYGLYVGILFFVVLYNVFLAASLRIFTYLHYAAVVILYLIISACVMDGYVLYFFPGANLTFLYSFAPSCAMVVSSLYAVQFLEAKKYAPHIYSFSMGIVLYFTFYLLIHFFLPRPLMLVLNQVNAIVSLVFMFSLGFTVGRNGNRFGYYFAMAYFAYLLIVIVEVVYIQTGSPRYLFGLSHVSIAILVEAIILAYLLSKRFNWEKEEIQLARQEAQRLLLKKTQENEQIVLDQNIRLEETVRQRTLEISQQKELVEKTLAEKEELLHEKEVLLKEIHHRVKNNLQTISSILMVQGAGLKDEQAKKAIAESQTRVSSIALVHQKLYQTDGLEKVELKAFIHDLGEQVKSFYSEQSTGVKIILNAPEVYILIDTAIPLGLMLNELLTNSFKYAFTAGKDGVINIEFHEVGHNPIQKSKSYCLTYSDNGPGLESAEDVHTSTTLGLRLIKLLSRQISADMQYRNTGSSSEFSFNFSILV